jgi:hypothetical protein
MVRCRCLLAIVAILVLTATLASRTAQVTIHRQTTVSADTQKPKIQHRDNDGSKWAPPAVISEPFYLEVFPAPIQRNDDPLLPVHVDKSSYNRPPPRF